MSVIIVLEGEEREQKFPREFSRVRAYCGFHYTKERAQFGIGLKFLEGLERDIFVSSLQERNPLRLWRAMALLETGAFATMTASILLGCLEAAHRDLSTISAVSRTCLEKKLQGGSVGLARLHAHIQERHPTPLAYGQLVAGLSKAQGGLDLVDSAEVNFFHASKAYIMGRVPLTQQPPLI